MPNPIIDIDDHGLQKRMAAYPQKLAQVMPIGMDASLLILWENVPPYAPEPPNSTYTRQGILGKSLGSSMSGGKSGGQPSIFTSRKIGSGYEGRFGTNLGYAEYVIGEGTQAEIHEGRWWTIKKIADESRQKITDLWDGIMDKLAAFLDGKEGV